MEKFKSLFSKNNIFYTLAATLTLIIVVTNRAINGFSSILWINDFGTIFFILYAIFAAKHKRIYYIFNILSCCFVGASAIIQHLWLNAVMSLLISVPAMTYGFLRWGKNEKQNKDCDNIKTLSKKHLIMTVCLYFCTAAIFAVILWLLGGNLFWLDAIYSAACVVGIILCSMAYIDQFYFFIFANSMGVILYLLLTLQNINNLTFILTMLIMVATSTMGLVNWRKIKNGQQTSDAPISQTEEINKEQDPDTQND